MLGLDYQVQKPHFRYVTRKSYADNMKWNGFPVEDEQDCWYIYKSLLVVTFYNVIFKVIFKGNFPFSSLINNKMHFRPRVPAWWRHYQIQKESYFNNFPLFRLYMRTRKMTVRSPLDMELFKYNP